MDKVVDKLLIEFLVPSFLMALCLVLFVDLLLGSRFDLNVAHFSATFSNSILVLGIVLLSYLFNTSASSAMNLVFRGMLWRKTREYLIYRRLNIFNEPGLKEEPIYWGKYVYRLFFCNSEFNKIRRDVERARAEGHHNLYAELTEKLKALGVPERSYRSTVDLYDIIRTIVMASKDNSVTSWIQYHWSLLRLARSTLFPSFLLVILAPLALREWSMDFVHVIASFMFSMVFFCFQFIHYYYREKFMIYAMIGYFFIFSSKREEHRQSI